MIHRYFWPDTTPYASMLRTIASRWSADGHRVRVLTTQPSHAAGQDAPSRRREEAVDGLCVERLRVLRDVGGGLRQLVNLLVFPLRVVTRILTLPHQDLIMCSTVPQVTLGWFVSVAARLRRTPFVYHCMDLHPEIGRISGEFAHPLVYRTLLWMDLATMRRASRIVVLSEDMRRSVLARDDRLGSTTVIVPNFALPDFGGPGQSPLAGPDEGVLRVVFTGNLGRFQGLETAVDCLGHLPAGVSVELVLMGEGRARHLLEERAAALPSSGAGRVRFLAHGSVSEAAALMRTAHLGLVSLVPGVIRYAYPSKASTYAEQSLPLLVVCEPDSELATAVVERRLGWAVAPGDGPGLVAALTAAHALMSDPEGWMGLSRRVVDYAAASFGRRQILATWSALLADLDVHHELPV